MTDVTWETSTLRTWLNNDFYNAAFSADEKGVIIEQSLKNEDNEAYKTASDVYDIGNVVTHGDYVCTCGGVRPALHFNLSSSPLTKKGGVTAGESGITYSKEQEQGMTEAPKPETPATEAPTTEAPKPETPATEIPTTEIPKLETPATEAPTTEAPKLDHPTKLNLTNKKTYKTSRKVTVKDADGIQTIRLNGKSVKVKKGKESCSFKLSVYRKYLKKKGKWNKLVVTDLNGKKKTVKFKTK